MSGSQISYPHLVAVEYTGDTMVSLDFEHCHCDQGRRAFTTGAGLRMGSVLALLRGKYSARVWPTKPAGPIITTIERSGFKAIHIVNGWLACHRQGSTACRQKHSGGSLNSGNIRRAR
jgi:hypothetical protein